MKKKFVTVFLMAITMFTLVGCNGRYKETTNVVATIINKDYVDSTITLVPVMVGKNMVLQQRVSPSKFYVTLEYENITHTVDDFELYNDYIIGDEIECMLVTTHNKNGEVVKVRLEQDKL